jgi:two-component system, chemotaxis family, sensor kinase CheA
MELDSLISDFVSEASELLQKAETRIMELEEDYDVEKIHSIFRAFHTIKGNSGMFGFTVIQELSHKSEGILDSVRSGHFSYSRELADILLKSIDRLKQILADIFNEKNYSVIDVVSEIDEFREKTPNAESEVISNTLEESNFQSLETLYATQIKMAEEKKQNLYHYLFDILENPKLTIQDFEKKLNSMGNEVVSRGLDFDSLPLIQERKPSLPYFFLILTPEGMDSFESKIELHAKQKTALYIYTGKSEEKQGIPITTEQKSSDAFLRVKIDLLDDLINLVGETIITRNQLLQRAPLWNDPEGTAILSRMSQLITQLHSKIMHTRLQELNSVYQRISRIVRDTSRALGKQVELKMEGGEVELDKTMIDTILDALVHLIRNSVDHGIESPEERRNLGKREEGYISVRASLQTGNVRIQIEDDGRGLNYDKIKQSAIRKGMLTEAKAEEISQEELADFIFLPGVSTKEQVTETSGRGVGMDAVKTGFKKIGGTIHLTSVPGQGVKVTATIPQTVSVISCLLISVLGRRFAIFQKYISELMKFELENFSIVNGHGMYQLRENLIPIVHLGNLLFGEEKKIENKNIYIVVIRLDNYYFGLLFDEMLGTEEIVIKPLGDHFRGMKLFSGATIMGDGDAVLILDVFGIADYTGIHTIEVRSTRDVMQSIGKRGKGYVMFESSNQYFGTVSTSIVSIERILLDSIFHISNVEVIQYKDDIVPILRLEDVYEMERLPDKREKFILICLIEQRYLGILIDKVIDVVEDLTLVPSSGDLKGEGIVGQSIYQEKPTIVVDVESVLTKMNHVKFRWIGKVIEDTVPLGVE